MGVAHHEMLGLRDGWLCADEPSKMAVLREIREHRPRIVLLPWEEDRHPDHGAASRIIQEASFLPGLRKIDTGQEPFRPAQLLYYMSSWEFEPSFIVDISDVIEEKRRAILAYGTQVYTPGALKTEPPTFIASEHFQELLFARMAHYGHQIGKKFGEPFRTKGAIEIKDLIVAFGERTYLERLCLATGTIIGYIISDHLYDIGHRGIYAKSIQRERTGTDKGEAHRTGRRRINAAGMRLLVVDDIAREAGISKGSFYSFYPSREEFILSVFESWEAEYRGALIREVVEGKGTARERIERFFLGAFEILEREPGLAHLGMKEIQTIIERLPAERIEAHQAADNKVLAETFGRWVSEGLLAPDIVASLPRARPCLVFDCHAQG